MNEENNNQQSVVDSDAETQNQQGALNQPPQTSSRFNRQQISLILLGVVVILGAGLGYWYWQGQQQTVTPGGVYNSPGDDFYQEEPPVVLEDGTYYVPPLLENYDPSIPPKANTTVSWKTPAPTSDLKLVFSPQGEPTGEDAEKVLYFILGTRGANKVILAQAPAVDPSGAGSYFFEETSKGYVFMSLMSNQDLYRGVDSPGYYALSTKVTSTDLKTYYQGLVGPTSLAWSGINLKQPYLRPMGLFQTYLDSRKSQEGFSYKKVADLAYGELYEFQQISGIEGTNVDPEKFQIRRYVLKLPSGFYTLYNVTYNFLSDDRVPNITWADGTKNTDTYHTDASLGGCGNPGAYIVPERDISNALIPTGKTNTGLQVYEFNSVSDKTLLYFYHLQGGKIFNPETSKTEDISVEEWYKHHPVIALKNALGDYILMTNDAYGIMAECGKPVVYLYPTKTTHVSVQVGADVTISEPAYNKGWKVIAHPNGKLINSDGGTYESLFWEGLGHGEYPVVNRGFVVEQDKLESTIDQHLKDLGLNEKESQDFKDFWMSRMPNTPYVRLTWFTNAELDILAPMVVLPRPDTVIRVFLDFQGMDSAVSIAPQELKSIPRRGFTVVEWGGLLKK